MEIFQWAVFLLSLSIFGIAIRWFIREATGSNYPVAKAMDRLNESGELQGKDIQKILSQIDTSATQEEMAKQFTKIVKDN